MKNLPPTSQEVLSVDIGNDQLHRVTRKVALIAHLRKRARASERLSAFVHAQNPSTAESLRF
jgi:hypothetical protein